MLKEEGLRDEARDFQQFFKFVTAYVHDGVILKQKEKKTVI